MEFARTITLHECPTKGCHAITALLQDVYERARRTGETFHCPAGHTWHFKTKPTAEEVQIAQLRADVSRERDLRTAAEKKSRSLARKLTKAKKGAQ